MPFFLADTTQDLDCRLTFNPAEIYIIFLQFLIEIM